MTMSNQCKWISFGVMSLTVILLLLLFYGLESKSRCPEEGYLRNRENGVCYMKNSQKPCPYGLLFGEEEPKSHFGACSCPYMLTNRTIVYRHGACHYVFTKADCPEGHWLNVTAKGEPFCETNICLQHAINDFEATKNSNDDGDVDNKSKDRIDPGMHSSSMGNHSNSTDMPIYVPIKGGRCARLGHYAEGCPEGSVVRFHQNYVLPSCFDPPVKKLRLSTGAIGVGAYTSCPMGSAKAITGLCQPLFDFDFE